MDHVTLAISGLSHDGRAVGRLPEGLVVFVRDALPGQVVRAAIHKRKKSMAEAELVEVLTPSSDERPSPCIHHAHCGGCPWQSISYDRQLSWKHRLLHDALARLGKLDIAASALPPVLALPESHEWGYRNKMEFCFAPSSEPGDTCRPCLGLKQRASHHVVEVTDCLLQTDRTMRVLSLLRELAARSGLPAWREGERNSAGALRFTVIREPRGTAETKENRLCLVEIITGPVSAHSAEAEEVRRMGQRLREQEPGVTGFVHSVRHSPSAIAYGETTLHADGDVGLVEYLRLRGFENQVAFHMDHASFFQVNTAAAELLYNTATTLACPGAPERSGTCWDVYSGVGGLSLALSPWFETVLGLETVSQAVRLAKKNAVPYGNCRFIRIDARRLDNVFQEKGVPDLLCADPPRAGLARSAVEAILRARPTRLLMVSCNPATLARDLALLMPAYTLETVHGVDLFPQTPHVETVALLRLNNRG